MNNAQSIRQAITLDPALPELVAQAAMEPVNFVGFYFDEPSETWDYWTAERADATASNCYYTPAECRAMLIERGFQEQMNKFQVAIDQESNPAVRRVLQLNCWKIKSWAEYASWKKHGRKWVAIDWKANKWVRDNPRPVFGEAAEWVG
jgi:hypothetical protein